MLDDSSDDESCSLSFFLLVIEIEIDHPSVTFVNFLKMINGIRPELAVYMILSYMRTDFPAPATIRAVSKTGRTFTNTKKATRIYRVYPFPELVRGYKPSACAWGHNSLLRYMYCVEGPRSKPLANLGLTIVLNYISCVSNHTPINKRMSNGGF